MRKLSRFAVPAAAGALILPLCLNAALAALPLSHDQVNEMIEMLGAAGHDTASALSAHGTIDQVEISDSGGYRIWAKTCYVPVSIRREPGPDVAPGGGVPIAVTVGRVTCK